MGDEEVAQSQGGAQLVEQVDDAGLDGHVQGGDRLVEDQEAGFEGQGPGDADALALAAGEVARVAVGVTRLQPDQRHELPDPGADLAPPPAVGAQRFGDEVEDGQTRVQRRHRVLEDDLDVAAHGAAPGARDLGGVLGQDDDAARLGRLEVEDLQQRRRLAAAGLPHQGEGLAPAHVEGDARDGVDRAHAPLEDGPLHERELLDQVGDAQDLLALLAREVELLRGLEPGQGVDVLVAQVLLLDPREAAAGRELRTGGRLAGGVGPAVGAHPGQCGLALEALVLGHRAARGEGAARRLGQQRRGAAVERGQRRVLLGVQPGQGAEEPDRVRHPGAVEDVVDVARLHDAPGVHDGDAVGHARHDAQIVGDHDDPGAGLPLGRAQHVEDLGLDGHVQGRGGLVGDDEVGVVGDGDGDDGALAHAAGELVGIGVDPHLRVGDAHEVEQLDGALARVRVADAAPVDLERLDDLLAHRVHGGERGQRVLEDHGDLGAAEPGHVGVGAAEDLGAVEPDRPGDRGGLVEQPHDRRRGDRLARAGLADQGQDLAAAHVEVDPAHRVDATVLGGEGDPEAAHLEERRARGGVRLGVGVEPGSVGLGAAHALPPDLDEESNASRTPSPMRLTHTSRATRTRAG